MRRHAWTAILLALGVLLALTLKPVSTTRAQDGQNLPTELYWLLNDGQVQRFGLGAAGITTVSYEDDFVLDFAVARDNNLMAYRTEQGLYVGSMFTDRSGAIRIDELADLPPLRGRGITMAWSPLSDSVVYTTPYGARVAFDLGTETTFTDIATTPLVHLQWSPNGTYLAAEAENDIWWIYRRDGTQMVLASAIPSSSGTAWLTDTQLLFAPADGGLILMDMAQQNQQLAIMDASRRYRRPFVRADLTIQVFVSDLNPVDLPPEQGFLLRLALDSSGNVISADESEVPVDLDGLAWAPGGDFAVQFSGGGLSLILPLTGEGFAVPATGLVAYGWGAPRPAAATGFTASSESYFRAPDSTGIIQVWQLPRSGVPPIPLTPSGADVTAYAVSRDSRQIIYASDGTLWLLPLQAGGTVGEASEITDINEERLLDLTFTPDGASVVYVLAPVEDRDETAGVWSLALNSGEQTQLLSNTPGEGIYNNVSYAPNVDALLLMARNGEARVYRIYDTVSGEVLPLGVYGGAIWLSDGRVAAYRTDDGTLDAEVLVIDTAPGAEPVRALRASDSTIVALVETAPGQIAALLRSVRQFSPAPMVLVQAAVDEGEPDDVGFAGYLFDPVISGDGVYVAGTSHPGGPLLVYNAAQNQALTLSVPAAIYDFQWSSFS